MASNESLKIDGCTSTPVEDARKTPFKNKRKNMSHDELVLNETPSLLLMSNETKNKNGNKRAKYEDSSIDLFESIVNEKSEDIKFEQFETCLNQESSTEKEDNLLSVSKKVYSFWYNYGLAKLEDDKETASFFIQKKKEYEDKINSLTLENEELRQESTLNKELRDENDELKKKIQSLEQQCEDYLTNKQFKSISNNQNKHLLAHQAQKIYELELELEKMRTQKNELTQSRNTLISSLNNVVEQNDLFEAFKNSNIQKAYVLYAKRIERCSKQLDNLISFCRKLHEGVDIQDLIIDTCIIKYIKIEDYVVNGLLTEEFLHQQDEQLKEIERNLNFLKGAVLKYHQIDVPK